MWATTHRHTENKVDFKNNKKDELITWLAMRTRLLVTGETRHLLQGGDPVIKTLTVIGLDGMAVEATTPVDAMNLVFGKS